MSHKKDHNFRRVVVTGMGAITSLGREVDTIWEAVTRGRSGTRQIRQYDSSHFPVKIGSEVDLDFLDEEEMKGLDSSMSRSILFGVWSMEKAWKDSQLDHAALDLTRAGVCIGASSFPVVDDTLQVVNAREILKGGIFNVDNTRLYMEICRQRPDLLSQRNFSLISTVLSSRHHLQGASMTVQSACSSGSQAIGEAYHLIRQGQADMMITGGADSMLTLICVTGFTLLGALSTRQDSPGKASRPFDRKRDGFVLGEGGGIVILEELNHALRRNAPIYAELIGYGSSSDGYRFTDIHPEGIGAVRCMKAALENAGINKEDVGYINAHGTSTWQNDRVETMAIKEVFEDHAYELAVSSTKSQLGHLICAAGGIELILTVMVLKTGILPPTINLENPDPECDLDYVPNTSRTADVEVAISNSFGFGGQNGTLVLRRWQGIPGKE